MNAKPSLRPPLLIVGVGSIGERHLRCFRKTGRVDLAFCEPNDALREEVAQRYSVKAFPDLAKALDAGDYLGAVLCIPAHLHVPMAAAVLTAGISLLIEKPLSVSSAGTADLLRLRSNRKLAAGVGYVLRFSPVLRQARAFLRQGEFGKPRQVIVVSGQHFPSFRPAYRETYYISHETGGGAIQDALTHLAHNVEWLLGPTESLYCDASCQVLEGTTVEDTVNVLARNGDVLVNYAMNQFQAPNEHYYWIHCEKGSIRIEFHQNRWGVLPHGGATWTWHETPIEDRDAIFIAQANAFLDAIEGKETDLCSLEEGIQTLEFNLAALRSARTGRKLALK